jgi:hypothetical protein
MLAAKIEKNRIFFQTSENLKFPLVIKKVVPPFAANILLALTSLKITSLNNNE